MATSPIYPSGIANIAVTLVNSDSTAWKNVYDNSAASSPARVEALNVCSDDTATMNVQLGYYTAGVTILIGTARVVTLSGTDGAAARVNALLVSGTLSPDGVPVIEVEPGAKLQARVLVAVTSAKTVSLTGWVRKFA